MSQTHYYLCSFPLTDSLPLHIKVLQTRDGSFTGEPRVLVPSAGTLPLNPKISPRDLTAEVVPDPNNRWPIAGGGFANIYVASWSHSGKEVKVRRPPIHQLIHLKLHPLDQVAVKVLKLPRNGDQNSAEIARKVCQPSIQLPYLSI